MTVECQVTRFQKTSTSANGTTQDVALNFTPKAIIVFESDTLAGNDDTFNQGLFASYGFSDGTNHACISIGSLDAQATTDTGSQHNTNAVYAHTTESSFPGNTLIRASCSFISNAVRFTYDVNTANTPWIYVIAFGGDDITDVKVNTVSIGSTSTGAHDYTGLGFTPTDGDAILFTTEMNIDTNNVSSSHADISIGCATSTTKRWTLANVMEDGRAASDTWRYFSSSRCIASLINTTGAIDWLADFNGWISDGFQLDVEDAAASANSKFSYMVINGGKWDVGTETIRTGAGTETTTCDAALVTMKGVCMVGHGSTTVDSVAATSHLSLGVSDGTTEGWMGFFERTALDPSQNIRRHSTNNRFNATITMGATTPWTPSFPTDSTFSSFGTNQFTVTYSVSPTAFPCGWWAVGEAAVVAVEEPPRSQSYGKIHSHFDNNTGPAIFG